MRAFQQPRVYLSAKQRFWALAGIGILVIVVWGLCLWHWDLGYNSDVAMIGLMAKRILENGERPIFVWSVGYQGVFLEAYLAAFLFKLFGISPLVLSLSPTILAVLMLAAFYVALAYYFDERVAVIATVLFIISSPPIWSQYLRSLPNYPDANLGGWLSILLASYLLKSLQAPTPARRKIMALTILLGALHGFFYYIFAITAYYCLAIFLQGFFLLLQARAAAVGQAPLRLLLMPDRGYAPGPGKKLTAVVTKLWWSLFCLALLNFLHLTPFAHYPGFKPVTLTSLKHFFLFFACLHLGWLVPRYQRSLAKFVPAYVTGLLIGYSPALYFHFIQGQSFGRSPRLSGAWSDLEQRFGIAARYHERLLNWQAFPPLSALMGLVILAAAVITLVVLGREQLKSSPARPTYTAPVLLGRGVMFFFPCMVLAGFFSSSLVVDDEHGRYLTPLMLFYAFAVGHMAMTMWDRYRGFAPRAAVGVMLAVLLGINFSSLRHFLLYFSDKHREIDAIVSAFDANQLTRGYAEYWQAYAVDLAVNERIVLQPLSSQYNPHYDALVRGQPRIGLIQHRQGLDRPHGDAATIEGIAYQVVKEQPINGELDLFVLTRRE